VVSRQQESILSALRQLGPLSTGEVNNHTNTGYQIARRQLARLEKAGLVRRDMDKWSVCNIDPGQAHINGQKAFSSFLDELKELQPLPDPGGSNIIPLNIPWGDLAEGLEDNILAMPMEFIYALQREYCEVRQLHDPPFFSIGSLPDLTEIRALGADSIGSLVMVRGDVVANKQPTPRIAKAVWRCVVCNAYSPPLPVPIGENPRPPLRCWKYDEKPGWNGHCGESGPKGWVLETSRCVHEDEAWVQLEETTYTEAMKPAITVRISQWLCERAPEDRKIMLGNTLQVVGVYQVQYRKDRHGKMYPDPYIEASSIEVVASDITRVELSEEDIAEIEAFAQKPDVIGELENLVAPDIYGLHLAKRATLLAATYKPKIRTRGGSSKRCNINLLLISHTGKAKSQLLKWWTTQYPKASGISAPGATQAGLYAMAQRSDERLGGRFSVVAGVIPRGNMGIICLDEIEKQLARDGPGPLYHALESREIPFAKGDVKASLPCDAPFIMASNWKAGMKRDRHSSIKDNLPKILDDDNILSRCVVLDVDSLVKSEDVEHIRGSVQAPWAEENTTEKALSLRSKDISFIIKYIAYARRLRPTIPMGGPVAEAIIAYTAQWQGATVDDGAVSVSFRLQEDFSRLVMSSAMLHLREVPTLEDVEAVLPILQHMITTFCQLPAGNIDLGKLGASGMDSGQEDRIQEAAAVLRLKGPMELGALMADVDGFTIEDLEAGKAAGILEEFNGMVQLEGYRPPKQAHHTKPMEDPPPPDPDPLPPVEKIEKPRKQPSETPNENENPGGEGSFSPELLKKMRVCLQQHYRPGDRDPNTEKIYSEIFTTYEAQEAWEAMTQAQREELRGTALRMEGWTIEEKGRKQRWKPPQVKGA